MKSKKLLVYEEIWDAVREEYESTFIVTERGLQCALYKAWLEKFPEVKIAIEPNWQGMIPDMVFIEQDDYQIIGLAELKYEPHWYPTRQKWQRDIDKLASYPNGKNRFFAATIDTITGQYGPAVHRVSVECDLHFAIVAQYDAEALSEPAIRDYIKQTHGNLGHDLYLWIGRSGPAEERRWTVTCIAKGETGDAE